MEPQKAHHSRSATAPTHIGPIGHGVQKHRRHSSTGGSRAWTEEEVFSTLFNDDKGETDVYNRKLILFAHACTRCPTSILRPIFAKQSWRVVFTTIRCHMGAIDGAVRTLYPRRRVRSHPFQAHKSIMGNIDPPWGHRPPWRQELRKVIPARRCLPILTLQVSLARTSRSCQKRRPQFCRRFDLLRRSQTRPETCD